MVRVWKEGCGGGGRVVCLVWERKLALCRKEGELI
jgi:hypothetical protein